MTDSFAGATPDDGPHLLHPTFRAGLLIWGAVAVLLNRSVEGLVWGIGSLDPATYVGAAIAITAGTAAAAWAAARRAGRIDRPALIRS